MKHKVVWALLAVFLLPVGLAYVTLQMGWFTSGANNKGEWVEGNIGQARQWRLLLPVSDSCSLCGNGRQLLEQVDLALGRDSQRVEVVQLAASEQLEAGFVYIADPPGTLILRYPLSGDPGQSLQIGKALLGDLRRLLKLSRAG
ncbi:hypothetical protein [Zobellella maritima]|uniref:hypothetical protein n=1 Tax=Zobellella maritima TaxID=2059725 RepID=UPI000E301A3D|nr:hypothetical protein [Zobellella maritima]